jgi:hypothetical protein
MRYITTYHLSRDMRYITTYHLSRDMRYITTKKVNSHFKNNVPESFIPEVFSRIFHFKIILLVPCTE